MKNKVLIASVITIGVVGGTYFTFSDQSDSSMAYSGYKVTEKQSENTQKYSRKVILSGMEIFSFYLTKSTYELSMKKEKVFISLILIC